MPSSSPMAHKSAILTISVDSNELDEDPLSLALAPPPNESDADRTLRLEAEAHAQKISDAIDEEINKQRMAEKKGENCIRILLLGQSESGKSTTLKNFQLINHPKAFQSERGSWRAVVQLNVVRSIRRILDAIADAQTASKAPVSPYTASEPTLPELNSDHYKLRMRLLPLLQVEEALLRRLAPGEASLNLLKSRTTSHSSVDTPLPHTTPPTEIAVNASVQWKVAFSRFLSNNDPRTSFESGMDIDFDDPQDPGRVLHACAEDMKRLWADPIIQDLLKAKGVRLRELGGFFLDSLDRVAAARYIPTDDDILRARLKTLGASEHRVKVKAGRGALVSHDWRVYDVGGARSLRAAWVPFFDNMDAIIFLAPISCYDQVLEEDPNVNRLADSVLLWKLIVSSKLLQNTQTVLFLNKADILQNKLAAGIPFKKYVLSYGDRPNDFENASLYLKRKFGSLHKQHSPVARVLYCHVTNVTDMKSTHSILGNVKDMVVRQNLAASNLV